MKEFNLEIPVLLIGFNRPEVIQKTFQYIENTQPKKLYVAIDGPRHEIAGEDELVSKVKEIVQKVDWPCQTQYRFSEKNKGAEITVSSAIAWVFEKELYAIILEDDIVAPLSFFKFAQEMLLKYFDNERIGIISGNNFTPIPLKDKSDYFFAKYAHSWGWATWRRVWESFDLNIEINEKHLKMDYLKTISNSRNEALFYKKRFNSMKKKGAGNNTWDMVANYISRINNRINIVPRINLSSNIGILGLHARGETVFHNLPFDEHFEVTKHPEHVEINDEYDKHHFQEHILKYQINFYQRIINKITRLIIGKNFYK